MQKLKAGDLAPDLQALTILDEVINLNSFQGKIWLAFYRYASCPMCDEHFENVLDVTSTLQGLGITYIALFESAIENFPPKIKEVRQNNLHVVPDPLKYHYENYRIEVNWPKLFHREAIAAGIRAHKKGYRPGVVDGKIARIPAHFLIYDGLIHEAHYGAHAGHHIPVEKVIEFGQSKVESGVPLAT